MGLRPKTVTRGSGLAAATMLFGLMLPGLVQADDLGECMASKMGQVDDSTTIGELSRSSGVWGTSSAKAIAC